MRKKSIFSLLLLTSSLFLAGCGEPSSNTANTSSSTTASESSSVSVTGVTVSSANNVRSIKEGETLQLTATVFPQEAAQSVSWSSSDETIATVSASGLVTAIKKGNVTITATSSADTSKKGEFSLVVEEGEAPLPTAITITASAKEVTVGENLTLVANVTPENADDQVTWSSSDETIATVSATGSVRGVAEGKVTVTAASVANPEVKGTIEITVKPAENPGETTDWSAVEYMSHADFLEAEDDTAVKIKGKVLFVSPVSADGTVNYYIQNGAEGFYVYGQNNSTFPVEVGKVYEVGGFKDYYRGQLEIKNVEHFVSLTENIDIVKSDVSDLDLSSTEATNPYHASYITFSGASIVECETGSSSYNFTLSLNDKEVDVRVDSAMMTDEEFAAINAKLANAFTGADVSMSGIMSAFGYGTPAPQILLLQAEDIEVEQPSDDVLVQSAIDSLTLPASLDVETTELELSTTIAGFQGIEVSYTSSNASVINPETGAVVHGERDVLVELTATATKGEASKNKKFQINVLGTAIDTIAETVHTLDLEDAAPSSGYGDSDSKSSYTAGTVVLGKPEAKTWMLDNALIGGQQNDLINGTFAIRAQKESHIRLEEDLSTGIDIVEFQAAIYGNDAGGIVLNVSYLPEGKTGAEDWKTVDYTAVLNSKTFETLRFTLPETASRISIDGNNPNGGRRYNIDDIHLMAYKA